MRVVHRIGRIVGLLALLLGPARAAEPEKIIVGINSLTAIYWPTYIAQEKGLFAANDLAPDIIMVGSPVSGLQQLIGGSLDLAHPTLYVAVNGAAHGGKFVLIGCTVNTLPYTIMSDATIKTAGEMKGKAVSLGFKGDVMTLIWQRWLETQGVKPSDVDEIYDAQAANRYAALAGGAAAVLNAPFDLRAAKEGYFRLLDIGARARGYAMATLAVRPDWLAAHEDLARRYLKTQAQAIRWLYEPANKAEAIAILARGTKQDPAVAAETYDEYVGRLRPFSASLELPADYLARTFEAAVEIGDVGKGASLPANLRDTHLLPQ